MSTDRYYHRDGSSCADGNCGRTHVAGLGAMADDNNAELRGLAEAREALARFDGDSRDILARRLSGKRKSAPMNRRLPNAETYLRTALAEVDRLRAENEGLRAKVDAAAKRWTWSPAGTAWHLFFHAPGGMSGVMLASILTRGDGMLIPFVAGQKRAAADDTIAALTTIRALLGADVPTLPTDRSDK